MLYTKDEKDFSLKILQNDITFYGTLKEITEELTQRPRIGKCLFYLTLYFHFKNTAA